MSKTVWAKKAKEGFVENMKNKGSNKKNPEEPEPEPEPELVKYEVADYGDGIYVGQDPDELILTNNKKIQLPTTPPVSTPITPKGIVDISKIQDAYNNADFSQGLQEYKNTVKNLKNGAANIKNDIARFFGSWFYDTFESPESMRDLTILSNQISRWIAVIPMSYLMVINWWYIMCYSNYVIDFRTFILPSIEWAMAPPFFSLELINYYILTFRMDRNATFPVSVEQARDIWNWRPVVFSAMHLVLFLFALHAPLLDVIESTLVGSGALFMILTVSSIIYFAKLFITKKWFDKPIFSNSTIGMLGLIGLLVISFACMFVFILLICPIFTTYLLLISYCTIFILNWFSPSAILSVYSQMFQELKEAPVTVTDEYSKTEKLKNAIFQNFHSIYLLVLMVIFFGINMDESKSFANPSLIVFSLIVNILVCLLFAPSAFSVPYIIFRIFFEDTGTKPPPPVGESAIGDTKT